MRTPEATAYITRSRGSRATNSNRRYWLISRALYEEWALLLLGEEAHCPTCRSGSRCNQQQAYLESTFDFFFFLADRLTSNKTMYRIPSRRNSTEPGSFHPLAQPYRRRPISVIRSPNANSGCSNHRQPSKSPFHAPTVARRCCCNAL